MTINILPDDVLLYIFFVEGLGYHGRPSISLEDHEDDDRVRRLPWMWHRLVHVCRRWRSIVFASPNFLDLRLVCGPMTLMKLTRILPPLPIIITNAFDSYVPEDYDFDALIMHPNRVREIYIVDQSRSVLQRLASVTWMQEQFTALTHLTLVRSRTCLGSAPVLPDGFLGGSAPHLQSLALTSILFPALPNLLMSATHLVRLALRDIPHSGYFSPEVIVTALANLVNLECLIIRFISPLSRPNRKIQSPTTLISLPALTRYEFKGASEYLEDFVAQIDAPSLNSICITFFPQPIFDIPRLAQFMGRITWLHKLKEAHFQFGPGGAYAEIRLPATRTIDGDYGLSISCRVLDWRHSSESSLAQVFTSFVPSIYIVDHLYIYEAQYQWHWQDDPDVEYIQWPWKWLEIFLPFSAVNSLYLTKKIASSIARALQELVGSGTTEVLPTLQNIFLEGLQPSGHIPEGIQKFVAARQLSGNPIIVSIWERGLWRE